MDWMEVAQLALKGIQYVTFWTKFKAWQKERDERLAREAAARGEAKAVKFTMPTLPPGAAMALIVACAYVSMGNSGCRRDAIKTAADLEVYCCDPVQGHPDECLNLPVPVPCPRRTATPTAAQPTPTPQPATPTPPIEQATSTPTTAPTANPTRVPTQEPTAAPTLPPATEGCLVRDLVPNEPVRVLTQGPCKRTDAAEMRRVDFPDGQHGCVAYWHCADGNDRFNIPSRVGDDIHFGNLQPAADGFIANDEHPEIDAYGRRLNGRGGFIEPGLEPDGYQPERWESANICRPFICPPTPTPTRPPTPGPTQPPIDHGCALPRGTGDGLESSCQRTGPRLLGDVDTAISHVLWAHPTWSVNGAGQVIVTGQENAFREAVMGDLRAAGFCAFFDGEEIAVKNTNTFSEQYAIVSSTEAGNRVRRGDNSYRATCTPAWSAIPATSEATPTPPPTGAVPPLLVLVRVGDNCSNPKEGSRYAVRHECVVDSTNWYRDPATPDDTKRDGPCDQDHALAWATFCHERSHDDPRGVVINVTGAEWARDESNPQRAVVTFTPGQEFMVCVRPFADAHNDRGQVIPVLGTAEQCKSQVHE